MVNDTSPQTPQRSSRMVLITGGAGFIGSHTADLLLARGYRVRALDLLDPQVHGVGQSRPAYLDPRIELQVGDVRSRTDVTRALEGVDAVFHFAAQTGVGQSMYEIHGYCDVNVTGTAMLLDVLANTSHQVKKIILASSRAVYGEGAYHCVSCGPVFPSPRTRETLDRQEWDLRCPACGRGLAPVATSEDKPAAPISIYALTKNVQEQLVRMFSSTYRLPAVILRYFNVYGSRQSLNNPYTGIGAIFTSRALAGCEINIYEDGKPGRDFVNVRDVARANLLALENHRADNGVFNIGSGERLTVQDLAEMIKKELNSSSPLSFTGQFRLGDIRDCYADLTDSRRILGFEPQVPFVEGVRELVDWARNEHGEDRSAVTNSSHMSEQ